MSSIPDFESNPVPVVKEGSTDTLAGNPFITLEALGEHIGATRYAASRMGVDMGDPAKAGTIAYHLRAIEEAHDRLFQRLAKMLPDNYRWGG
jgi:hypothetical protein